MPLSPGDKLGPYECVAPIGKGGMGEVYKALDTRLDRTVAIKVLPDHIAKRDDLRARFEREARAVASLNHPNICTLHDIGPGYMVMELIEGESLAAAIEKGPIPLEQALKFAIQIADALDRAHRAGVTHRDVKPQNIMLTRDGVKVLDFGLAKSRAKPGPTEETLTAVLTTEGTVMGTPQYMAPEQFAGKEADARSDVWAFGAVLYEMVTGRKAFVGSNYQSLVGAILATDPAPMAVKPFTPSWLERLVRRCLDKDPEDRWQTMRDIVIELRTPPQEAVVAAGPTKASRWPWVIAAAATLGLIIAGVLLYNTTRPAPLRPLQRLNVEIAPDKALAISASGRDSLALSPDGTRLVLGLVGPDGKVQLHTRLLHQSQTTPLAGTENAYGPFFSPAGDWIGFHADGKLRKIPVEGGAAVTLCDASQPYGVSWSEDGSIIAALGFNTVLSRIPADGGTPVPVTKFNGGERTHRWPHVIPGTPLVVFTAVTHFADQPDDATIEVISLETGERKTLVRQGFSARYLSDSTGLSANGHLLYLKQTTLYALPFEPRRMAVSGAPVPILEDVASRNGGGFFAFGRNGTFIYLPRKAARDEWPISFVAPGPAGTSQRLNARPGSYYTPRFSPDGKRLAFASYTGTGADIWVKDLDRDTASRLTSLPGRNTHPLWSPDGKFIIFSSDHAAAPGYYVIRADGSSEAKRLSDNMPGGETSLSPDGKRLAVMKTGSDGQSHIFTIPVEGDFGQDGGGLRLGKAELFLETRFGARQPAFSPDGRWLSYSTNESGRGETFVRPFPGPGGRWQISSGGGSHAVWSRDGRDILFHEPGGRVMAVAYTAKGDTFVASQPRVWTETRLRRGNASGSPFDISPDGKRLAAMIAPDRETREMPTHLTFLLNFIDELQRKAPLGR